MKKEAFKEISKEFEWLEKNRNYYLKAIKDCNINNHERVLDLGCGNGLWSFELLKNNNQVYGIDINKKAIQYANFVKEKKRLNKIHFVQGSAESLPFKDGFFDAVISISVLQYVNREKVFKEIVRVLKTNGEFISILNHGFGYYLKRSLQLNREISHVLKWSSSLFRQIILKLFKYHNNSLNDLFLTRGEVDSLCKKHGLLHRYVVIDHPFYSGNKKYLFTDFVISFISKNISTYPND